ncbi:hypothetical protein MMC29_008279, partial [Sticta canariensis]|nr:hypothetical protein [Sticta canariensis]
YGKGGRVEQTMHPEAEDGEGSRREKPGPSPNSGEPNQPSSGVKQGWQEDDKIHRIEMEDGVPGECLSPLSFFIKSATTAERQRHKLEPSSEMTRASEIRNQEARMGEEIQGKDDKNKQSNEYEGLQRSTSLAWH